MTNSGKNQDWRICFGCPWCLEQFLAYPEVLNTKQKCPNCGRDIPFTTDLIIKEPALQMNEMKVLDVRPVSDEPASPRPPDYPPPTGSGRNEYNRESTGYTPPPPRPPDIPRTPQPPPDTEESFGVGLEDLDESERLFRTRATSWVAEFGEDPMAIFIAGLKFGIWGAIIGFVFGLISLGSDISIGLKILTIVLLTLGFGAIFASGRWGFIAAFTGDGYKLVRKNMKAQFQSGQAFGCLLWFANGCKGSWKDYTRGGGRMNTMGEPKKTYYFAAFWAGVPFIIYALLTKNVRISKTGYNMLIASGVVMCIIFLGIIMAIFGVGSTK